MTGYTETQADRLKDRIGLMIARAKLAAEQIVPTVPDSSEVGDAQDEALAALGRLEAIAEEVIDERIR